MGSARLCLLFSFFSRKQAKMADSISEAERTQHDIGRQTRNAIVGTGTIQSIIALATLLWTVWWALREKREEKRRKKEKDDGDKRRREKEDDEDKRRRKRADEEDARRMEEMERMVGERVNAALQQFEGELNTIRYVH